MRVRHIMTRRAKACEAGDSLRRAAQIMWEEECGFVPVLDADDRPIAVITDRDVCMAAYTQGTTLSESSIESVGTREPITVDENEGVRVAARIMGLRQVRRLIVTGAAGRMAGVLSIHDLAHRFETDDTLASCIRDALASICRPRGNQPLRAETRPHYAEDLMTPFPRRCTTSDPATRAAQLMWEGDWGAVPVTRKGDCVAMVTDRDIAMAAYIQNKPLSQISVMTPASRRIHSLDPSSLLEVAHEIMRRHRIRRVPVVDRGHNLIGIVSLADIARHTSPHALSGDSLSAQAIAVTLARIGHWRDDPDESPFTIPTRSPGDSVTSKLHKRVRNESPSVWQDPIIEIDRSAAE